MNGYRYLQVHSKLTNSAVVWSLFAIALVLLGAREGWSECNSHPVVSVSNPTQLNNALLAAQGCEIISLAPGEYGSVSFSGYPNNVNYNYPEFVTITSSNTNDRARFSSIALSYASRIRFSKIVLHHPKLPNEEDWSRAVDLSNSNYLEFVDSEFYGSEDGDYTNDIYGLVSGDVDNLRFERNSVHDWYRGTVIGEGNHITVKDNHYYQIRSDGADFADLVDVLVEGNSFTNFYPCCGDHPDMIQFWNDNGQRRMTDVVIRGNTMLRGPGDPTQSIFIQANNLQFRNEDFLIENNVIYNGHSHGITVYDTDGVVIRNNTVLEYRKDPSELVASINTYNNTATVVESNVASAYSNIGADTVYNNNVTAQNGTTAPERALATHFDNLFLNAQSKAAAVREDFLPKLGSLLIVNPGQDIGALEYDSTPASLTALILTSVSSGAAPISVQFDGSLSGGPNPINEYLWSFGDGQFGSGPTVEHSYLSPGNYNVTLSVTDTSQNHDTYQKTIVVNPPPVVGLVLGLTFNDTILDYSANAIPTVWDGSPSFGAGKVGAALQLDGSPTGSFVVAPHKEQLDGMTAFGLSFWARKNSVDSDNSVLNKHIVYSVRVGSDYLAGYIFNQDGERFDFAFSSESIQNQDWHHYFIRYDGTTISGFVDGALIGSVAANGPVAIHQDRDLYIGKNPWGATFDGKLDELKLFNIALSDQQIADLATPNTAPQVEAGDDAEIQLPDSLVLHGEVSDDGLPIFQSTSVAWTKVAGPGNVAFENQSSADTTVVFSQPGQYVLRLTANDGESSGSDEVSISVLAAPEPVAPPENNNPGGPSVGASVEFSGNLKAKRSKKFNLLLAEGRTISISALTSMRGSLRLSIVNSKGRVIRSISTRKGSSRLALSKLKLKAGKYRLIFSSLSKKKINFSSKLDYRS